MPKQKKAVAAVKKFIKSVLPSAKSNVKGSISSMVGRKKKTSSRKSSSFKKKAA